MINFKIIIPFYNTEKWLSKTVESLLSQKYDNFSCYFSDDISTDRGLEVLNKYKDPKLNIITNTEKKYALKNIYDTINYSKPSDEDVIVLLDGDDWLFDDFALYKLNYYYSNEDILLTYGTYVHYPQGILPSNVTSYSENVIKNNLYRKDTWRASHLRTFKYKLWKNIKIEDLKDDDGEFYRMAWDLAIMFPMLEMSGGKHKCVSDILYCYNTSNPINDHKVNLNLQLSTDRKIRNKIPYNKLNI
jgi:glycosyltransferase involved in cell wall biosynthesis